MPQGFVVDLTNAGFLMDSAFCLQGRFVPRYPLAQDVPVIEGLLPRAFDLPLNAFVPGNPGFVFPPFDPTYASGGGTPTADQSGSMRPRFVPTDVDLTFLAASEITEADVVDWVNSQSLAAVTGMTQADFVAWVSTLMLPATATMSQADFVGWFSALTLSGTTGITEATLVKWFSALGLSTMASIAMTRTMDAAVALGLSAVAAIPSSSIHNSFVTRSLTVVAAFAPNATTGMVVSLALPATPILVLDKTLTRQGIMTFAAATGLSEQVALNAVETVILQNVSAGFGTDLGGLQKAVFSIRSGSGRHKIVYIVRRRT